MTREQELELINYAIQDLEDVVATAAHPSDVSYRKTLLELAYKKREELINGFQIISVPMRNGHNIVVDVNSWSDEFPDDVCIYFEHNNTILQDIAIVREHKTHDSVEVLVYADHNNEDYTDKFEVEEHNFEEEDN